MAEVITQAPPLPSGRHVDLPGRGAIFVREIPGPAGAPTLLLLHGLGASADLNWFPAYGDLGSRFRVLAVDHRGHGRGIRSRRHFRLSDCADDAAAMLAELDVPKVIAVGYSMGGPIAQLLWHRHRELVSGLVLCATARNFRGHPAERLAFGGVAALSAAVRFVPAPVMRRAGGRLVPAQARGDGHSWSAWARGEMERHDLRKVMEAAHAIGRFSSHAWIGDVDVPTAVVATRYDQLVPLRRQHKLARSIRGATVHHVPGDHMCCGLAPGVFVPKLVEACESVASRAKVEKPAR